MRVTFFRCLIGALLAAAALLSALLGLVRGIEVTAAAGHTQKV
jgi:hypothetical protein